MEGAIPDVLASYASTWASNFLAALAAAMLLGLPWLLTGRLVFSLLISGRATDRQKTNLSPKCRRSEEHLQGVREVAAAESRRCSREDQERASMDSAPRSSTDSRRSREGRSRAMTPRSSSEGWVTAGHRALPELQDLDLSVDWSGLEGPTDAILRGNSSSSSPVLLHATGTYALIVAFHGLTVTRSCIWTGKWKGALVSVKIALRELCLEQSDRCKQPEPWDPRALLDSWPHHPNIVQLYAAKLAPLQTNLAGQTIVPLEQFSPRPRRRGPSLHLIHVGPKFPFGLVQSQNAFLFHLLQAMAPRKAALCPHWRSSMTCIVTVGDLLTMPRSLRQWPRQHQQTPILVGLSTDACVG